MLLWGKGPQSRTCTVSLGRQMRSPRASAIAWLAHIAVAADCMQSCAKDSTLRLCPTHGYGLCVGCVVLHIPICRPSPAPDDAHAQLLAFPPCCSLDNLWPKSASHPRWHSRTLLPPTPTLTACPTLQNPTLRVRQIRTATHDQSVAVSWTPNCDILAETEPHPTQL